MRGSQWKYCLELELGWNCDRVCCNLLRKECGKSDRKAIPWNCDRDKDEKLVQKTNIKNWKKFDVGGVVERRSLETMAKAAVKEVVDWVESQNVSDIDKMRND